jgi:ABC-type multidrug transport system ATPase subunit
MTLSIEARNLSMRYGDVTAIDDLSLALDGGKIYGLLGRNGSGKTTLLSALAAFRAPTEGQPLIGGQPVFENPAVTAQVCLIRETGATVDTDWPGDRVRHALAFAAALRRSGLTGPLTTPLGSSNVSSCRSTRGSASCPAASARPWPSPWAWPAGRR